MPELELADSGEGVASVRSEAEIKHLQRYAAALLLKFLRTGSPTFQGVPAHVRKARRKSDKQARKSRQINYRVAQR